MFSTQLMAIKKQGSCVQVTMRVHKKSIHAQYAQWEIKQWWPLGQWDIWDLNHIQVKTQSQHPAYMNISWQDPNIQSTTKKTADTIQPHAMIEVQQEHLAYLQELQSWLLDASLFDVSHVDDIQHALLYQQELDWCVNDLFNRKQEIALQNENHEELETHQQNMLNDHQVMPLSAPILLLEFDHSNRDVESVDIILESKEIPITLYYQIMTHIQTHELRLYSKLNVPCHCDQYDSFLLTVVDQKNDTHQDRIKSTQHPHVRWVSLWSLHDQNTSMDRESSHDQGTQKKYKQQSQVDLSTIEIGDLNIYQKSASLDIYHQDYMLYQIASWQLASTHILSLSKLHYLNYQTSYQLPLNQRLLTAPLHLTSNNQQQQTTLSQTTNHIEITLSSVSLASEPIKIQRHIYYQYGHDDVEYSLSDIQSLIVSHDHVINHDLKLLYKMTLQSHCYTDCQLNLIEPDLNGILLDYYQHQSQQSANDFISTEYEITLDHVEYYNLTTLQHTQSIPNDITLAAYQSCSVAFQYNITHKYLAFLIQHFEEVI